MLHCFGCDADKFTLNIYPQAFDSHKLVDTVNDVTITSLEYLSSIHYSIKLNLKWKILKNQIVFMSTIK